ncbi:MAG: hypothetical protein IJ033_02225 [Clostridia bacterium]|nr:hypothetical protein [Clostridia bacterium]
MSNLDLLQAALRDDLCTTRDSEEGHLNVATTFFFDGDSMSFRFKEVAPKTYKLSTGPNVLDWLAFITYDIGEYAEEIPVIARRFGAEWDGESLSITFRRNEMSLDRAYFKLIEVMGIVGSIRRYIYYPNKP